MGGMVPCARSQASGTVRGVAALEPCIEPIHHWKDSSRGTISGVAIPYAKANPDKIRASGLQIYRDCGDEDMFLLFEGSELLHRVQYDAGIKHEYHLVGGADHLGRTVRPRSMEALQFLTRVLIPPAPDPGAGPTRKTLAPLKAKAGVK